MNHDDKFDEMLKVIQKKTRRLIVQQQISDFIEDFGNLIGGIIGMILMIVVVFWILWLSSNEAQKEVNEWKDFLIKNKCVLVENGKMNGRVIQSSYLCNDGTIYWINQWIVDELKRN